MVGVASGRQLDGAAASESAPSAHDARTATAWPSGQRVVTETVVEISGLQQGHLFRARETALLCGFRQ